MPKTYREKRAEMSADSQARIAARADELKREYRTLKDLRKARELTQVAMAEKLNIAQSGIAGIEQRSDMMLSTFRGYVEALGGKLTMTAEFPDGNPVRIVGIGALDLEDDVAYGGSSERATAKR